MPGSGSNQGTVGEADATREDGFIQAADRHDELKHRAWVDSGCPQAVQGPAGWTQYTTGEGEEYYHNKSMALTQWDRPVCWLVS